MNKFDKRKQSLSGILFYFEFTRNIYKLRYGSQFNLEQDNMKHTDMFKTKYISKHNMMNVDQCFEAYRIFMNGRFKQG